MNYMMQLSSRIDLVYHDFDNDTNQKSIQISNQINQNLPSQFNPIIQLDLSINFQYFHFERMQQIRSLYPEKVIKFGINNLKVSPWMDIHSILKSFEYIKKLECSEAQFSNSEIYCCIPQVDKLNLCLISLEDIKYFPSNFNFVHSLSNLSIQFTKDSFNLNN